MIEAGLTDSFRAETMWGGIHLPQHEYYMALYTDSPDIVVLGAGTMKYDPIDEVAGLGYDPGGKMLSGRKVQLLERVVCLDFMSPVWPLATIRDVAAGLIYNGSLPDKNSVCVVDFGGFYTSINGPFVARLPEPGPTSSLVQWA